MNENFNFLRKISAQNSRRLKWHFRRWTPCIVQHVSDCSSYPQFFPCSPVTSPLFLFFSLLRAREFGAIIVIIRDFCSRTFKFFQDSVFVPIRSIFFRNLFVSGCSNFFRTLCLFQHGFYFSGLFLFRGVLIFQDSFCFRTFNFFRMFLFVPGRSWRAWERAATLPTVRPAPTNSRQCSPSPP